MPQDNWIVVANHSKAKFFYTEQNGKVIKKFNEIDFPEGRMHESEFASDRPGRAFDSVGGHRHAVSKEDDIKQQLETQFANTVSQYLDQCRVEKKLESLTLVAGPSFLGELKKNLPTETAQLISSSYDKNIAELSEHEITEYLKKLLFH